MKETIKLDKAFHLAVLTHHKGPVITQSDLHAILLRLYETKSFGGVRIGKIRSDAPEPEVCKSKVRALETDGIISSLIGSKVYAISGRKEPTAEEVGCYLYPYSYLCYLSAMDYHGLTDRIPKVVHLMVPSASQARDIAMEQVEGESSITSKRRNIKVRQRIDGKEFVYHSSKMFLKYKKITGAANVRVSSIGRTFLDMIKKPMLCGGFGHVLDVFEENLERYLTLVIKEFNENGSNLDKSRLGFLLDEVFGIDDPVIDKWATLSERGGSRVLVSGEKFSSCYSEKWCISINHKELQRYGTRG